MRPFWDDFGAIWDPFETIFGTLRSILPFWDDFGTFLDTFEHFWDNSGTILVQFWTILGPFWGPFGIIFRTLLGPFWDHFGPRTRYIMNWRSFKAGLRVH